MYQSYFGLNELPFELTANPRYLFLTARQREALSVLEYGLFAAKSLTLLVGEAGTGKTTLIRSALESERCRSVRCIYLNNPILSTADFVSLLGRRFDLGEDATKAKSVFLDRLEAALRERRARGEITALVVDEAQSLHTELLEEIRLLANIESPSEKLLPLVLAGQPELAERLEQHELRQLKQRVTLRCELMPFDLADTAAYIASRIHTAGGVPAGLFTQEAVGTIHECARGIPRTINVVCDNALVSAMALGRRRVDRAMVTDVCRDLRLTPGGGVVSPPALPEVAPLSEVPPAAWLSQQTGPEASPDNVPTGNEPVEDGSSTQPSGRFRFRFRWRSRPALAPPSRIPSSRILAE